MKKIVSILLFLIIPATQSMEQPLELQKKKLTIEYATALWQNHTYKKYQEDKVKALPLFNGYFFGVYDGHSSGRSTDNVSSFLQDNFHDLFAKAKNETIQEKLEDAFYQAEIHALKNFLDGSTAIVAYIDEQYILHLAWVGDSRAILEGNKTIVYETIDHDPFSNTYESERIQEHGMVISDSYVYNKHAKYGLSMSRSIGDRRTKEVTLEKPLGTGGIIATPEYHSIQLTSENNFLIIATDGLWFDVDSKKAVDVITELLINPNVELSYPWERKPDFLFTSPGCDETIKDAVQELGSGALILGSEDNIGIVIAQFKWQD